MKKEDKLWKKIYRMIDNKEYHICRKLEDKCESWFLYKKYDGWMTDGSTPLMTSDNHSVEELYKFIKKYRKIDIVSELNKIILPIVWSIFIFMILRLFFVDNKMIQNIGNYLLVFDFGICFTAIISYSIDTKKMDIELENEKLSLIKSVQAISKKGEIEEDEV